MAQDPNNNVFVHPTAARPLDDGFGFMPSFPVVASTVDSFVRRVPWWLVLAFGAVLGSGLATRFVKKWFGLQAA